MLDDSGEVVLRKPATSGFLTPALFLMTRKNEREALQFFDAEMVRMKTISSCVLGGLVLIPFGPLPSMVALVCGLIPFLVAINNIPDLDESGRLQVARPTSTDE